VFNEATHIDADSLEGSKDGVEDEMWDGGPYMRPGRWHASLNEVLEEHRSHMGKVHHLARLSSTSIPYWRVFH
jgi:hypothetical protein